MSECGRYSYFAFSARTAAEPIDFLEGYTVLYAVRLLAPGWRKCIVTIWIDNSAFQLSGKAGRSKVERLNWVLRRLLVLQVEYDFVIRYEWIPTDKNYLADHLSRGRVDAFLKAVHSSGQLAKGASLQLCGQPGVVVCLPRSGEDPKTD